MQRFISLWWSSRTWRLFGCRQAMAASPQLGDRHGLRYMTLLLRDLALAGLLGSQTWGLTARKSTPRPVTRTEDFGFPQADGTWSPTRPGSPVGELAPFLAGLGRAIWKLSVAATYIRQPLPSHQAVVRNHRTIGRPTRPNHQNIKRTC